MEEEEAATPDFRAMRRLTPPLPSVLLQCNPRLWPARPDRLRRALLGQVRQARIPLHLVPQAAQQERHLDRPRLLLGGARCHQVPGALRLPLRNGAQRTFLLLRHQANAQGKLGLLLAAQS